MHIYYQKLIFKPCFDEHYIRDFPNKFNELSFHSAEQLLNDVIINTEDPTK